MDKNTNNKIVALRRYRGLDRRDIAQAAGVDYLTVTKWEHGFLAPTERELLKIAENLSVPLEFFGIEAPAEVTSPEPEPQPEPRSKDKIEIKIDPYATSSKVQVVYEPKSEMTPPPQPTPEQKKKAAEESAPIQAEVKAPSPHPEQTAEPSAQITPAQTAPIPTEYEKAYAEKKARYEKYVRSSSYKRSGVKIRRMLAYAIDFVLASILAVAMLVGVVIVSARLANTLPNILSAIVIGACASLVIVALGFKFRDFIFIGRSLGKRIMGLTIIDERTAEKSAVYQRVLRAIITATPVIDLIFLLFRGKTVGDSVASTLVVSKRAYKAPVTPSVTADGVECYDIPEKKKKNRTLLTLLFVLALVASIVISAMGASFVYSKALDAEKQSDRYEVAYTYLVKSDAFLKSQATEAEVKLLSYYLEYSFDSDELVCAYTFFTNDDHYDVVLHLGSNTEWYVCNICTSFY